LAKNSTFFEREDVITTIKPGSSSDALNPKSKSEANPSPYETKTERLRISLKMCTTYPSCPHIQGGYPHFHPLFKKNSGFSTCG
jgi:hypothetical protein